MSVSVLSESRSFDRVLEFTRDAILPGIWDTAFDHSPLMAALLGRLNNAQFGPVKMNGRGKDTQTGGESIVVRHNLGKNLTAKTLTGPWDPVTADPSDTVRHSRVNWKHYSSTIVLSETDLLINSGPEALSSLVEFETRNAVQSLADLIADHAYNNASVSTRIASLQEHAAAGTTTFQGLSPSTYPTWFSRGLSARGTATGSVSFTSGSFSAQGMDDLRILWNNTSEGAIQPHALYTTYDVFNYYEAKLQASQRFTSTSMADGGFQQLAFKTAPIFPDPKCTSGEIYAVNFDFYKLVVLAGADLTTGPFERVEDQEARIAKVMFKANTINKDRRLGVNKAVSVTA
jgi:hypothetical protein